MKRLWLVLITVLFATTIAVGVSAITSQSAEAAAGPVKKCGGGKIFLKAKERKAFLIHNKIRRNHNLRPFCVHPKLQRAARAHSRDMIRRDYFSHNTKGRGEDAGARLRRFGYRWRTYGENIAWGQRRKASARYIVRQQWMKSAGHRRNILNPRFREIGIGTYSGAFNQRKKTTMYTADYGARR